MIIKTEIPSPFSCQCTTSSHDHRTAVCSRGVFTRAGDPCQSCKEQEAEAAKKHAQTTLVES